MHPQQKIFAVICLLLAILTLYFIVSLGANPNNISVAGIFTFESTGTQEENTALQAILFKYFLLFLMGTVAMVSVIPIRRRAGLAGYFAWVAVACVAALLIYWI